MTALSGKMAGMSYDTALETALDATEARLDHLDKADSLNRVRWQAYAEMAEEKSQRGIEDAMVAGLRGRGFSDERIRKAGVSHDNIAVGIGRVRG